MPVPKSFIVYRSRMVLFARADALIEESALRGIARRFVRYQVVLTGGFVFALSKFKLPKAAW